MIPADLQTPTAQSVLETLTQERPVDLSPSFGIGLRGGRDTKPRGVGRLGEQLTGHLPAHLHEIGRDEQIGAVHESRMGYHVVRVDSPTVRLGPPRVRVEIEAVPSLLPADGKRSSKDTCRLSTAAQAKVEEALESAPDPEAIALADLASGKANKQKNSVAAGRLVLSPGEERRRTGSHYMLQIETLSARPARLNLCLSQATATIRIPSLERIECNFKHS